MRRLDVIGWTMISLSALMLVLLVLTGCSMSVLTDPVNSSTRSSTASTRTTTAKSLENAPALGLPDSRRTPGAINPAVNQENIRSTVCRKGWTATIRPPSSYATSIKRRQLASGYAYRGDMHTGHYEEDHLISLELGGSPTSALNLWPEPYASTDGARVKDKIENKLNSLVCSGRIALVVAQHAIAVNWRAAYQKYIG